MADIKKKEKFLDLKIYKNKRNNQRTILLPKSIPRDKKKVRVIW